MFNEVNSCPIVLNNGDKAEEGFYRDLGLQRSGNIFYFSHKNGGYYIQYHAMSRPALMDNNLVRKIEAEKINPLHILQDGEISPDIKRFIKTKLAKTAGNKR